MALAGVAGNGPAASAAPFSHTVESVGKGILHKVAVNKAKYLRVVKWSNPSFSYRLVGQGNLLTMVWDMPYSLS
jgi:hypothetical protein